MAKKEIIFRATVQGEETIIYYIKDENTSKKHYYILQTVPDKMQNDQKELDKINAQIKYQNANNGTHFKLVSYKMSNGKNYWFVERPASKIDVYLTKYSIIKEINKEQKTYNEINDPQESIYNKNRTKSPSNKTIKILSVILGFTLTAIVGANINNAINNSNNSTKAESSYSASSNHGASSNKTQTSNKKISYTNLDNISWKTYTNTSGTKVVEHADMLKIAEACYNNLAIELKKGNHDYSFDISKFKPEMFVGIAYRESSLNYLVNNINAAGCRGLFRIGSGAVEDANEVAEKLTGEKIITKGKDLDDPVKAMMTAIYYSVKNYDYCANIIGAENVTKDMVLDFYNQGYVKSVNALKNCMDDGKYLGNYQPKNYSKEVLYYSGCFEEYNKFLKKGVTNGEHDSYWEDLMYNNLWKTPNFESESAEMQQ